MQPTSDLTSTSVGIAEHIAALNSRYAETLVSPIVGLMVRIGNEQIRREIVEMEGGTYAYIDYAPETEAITFVQDSDPIALFKKVEDWRDAADLDMTDEVLAGTFAAFWGVVYGFQVG